MSRELTAERIQQVDEAEKLWQQGYSTSEIGTKLRLSKNTVAGIVRKFPDKFPARSKQFTAAKIRANNMRMSAESREVFLKEFIEKPGDKVEGKKKGESTDARVAEVKKLRDAGATTGEIAKKLGLTNSTVAGIFARNRDLFPSTKLGSRTKPIEERKTRAEIYQGVKERALKTKEEKAETHKSAEIIRFADRSSSFAAKSKAEVALDKSLAEVFVPIDREANPASKIITMLNLKDSMCKFSIGYSEDVEGKHIFCGLPSGSTSSYCTTHHRLSYNPVAYRTR